MDISEEYSVYTLDQLQAYLQNRPNINAGVEPARAPMTAERKQEIVLAVLGGMGQVPTVSKILGVLPGLMQVIQAEGPDAEAEQAKDMMWIMGGILHTAALGEIWDGELPEWHEHLDLFYQLCEHLTEELILAQRGDYPVISGVHDITVPNRGKDVWIEANTIFITPCFTDNPILPVNVTAAIRQCTARAEMVDGLDAEEKAEWARDLFITVFRGLGRGYADPSNVLAPDIAFYEEFAEEAAACIRMAARNEYMFRYQVRLRTD